MTKKKIYLDNAATTKIDNEVLDAMLPVLREQFGNPSSIHGFGRQTRSLIEESRKIVSRLLNVSPSEIFFTSGGTEANNTAIHASIEDLGITHAITSEIEHHAVLHSLQVFEKKGRIKLSFVKLNQDGHVDLEHLDNLLKSNSKSVISLMHGNNELGNLLPLKDVGELASRYNSIFHSDTVQTMGHYKFDLNDLKLHFLTCAAHKFHGPKGIGFLYVSSSIKINPLIHGGSQERNMRGGTENVYGIIGLAKAMEIAYRDLDVHQAYITELKQYMITRLEAEIPGVTFNGECKSDSLYTVLNVSFPPNSKVSEMLLFNLDIEGIAASGGSACTSGSEQGSHVLRGIKSDTSRPSVRFSFSKFNTRDEIDYTVSVLKKFF